MLHTTRRQQAGKTDKQKRAISEFKRLELESESLEIEETRRQQASATLHAKVESIDSNLAAKYLRTMMVNRARNQSRVSSYSKMMLAGEWGFTNASIAFTTDGYLCDGQHRLHALIQASKSKPKLRIETVVVRGVDRENVKYIDNGQSRTALQGFKIAGIDTAGLNKKIYTCRALFIGRMIGTTAKSEKPPTLSNGRLFTLIESHDKALTFALKLAKGKCNKAPVHAVLTRAFSNCSEENLPRLSQFIEVLNTGFPIDGNKPGLDNSALALIHYAEKLRGMGGEGRVSLYRLTEFTLDAFMQGIGYKEISERDGAGLEELYPLADFD